MAHSDQQKPNPVRAYGDDAVIVAAASAVGGPIAIIRISGSGSHAILKNCIRRSRAVDHGVLYRERLFDPTTRRVLDDAMIVFFDEGRSFTGEESAEAHVHGNSIIVRNVLAALKKAGAVSALPGEFSFRAVQNGKMNLEQAQSVSDLITSSTSHGVDYALRRLNQPASGEITQGSLVKQLRALSAAAEVGIDFSDQDVEELSLGKLKRDLASVMVALEVWLDSYGVGRRLQHGVTVAIVGVPNAGKSSLFNALQGQDRAIVSEIAGTTRDIVSESLWLEEEDGTVLVRWLDTAGLRNSPSSDPIEAQGMARSLAEAEQADIVLFCWASDFSREGQAALFSEILQIRGGRTLIQVRTKSDIQDQVFTELGTDVLRVSSMSGEGLGELRKGIFSACLGLLDVGRFEAVLTQERQVESIESARNDFDRALLAPELDLFAADLKQGMRHLSEWVGGLAPDDILNHIFSEFCIGK